MNDVDVRADLAVLVPKPGEPRMPVERMLERRAGLLEAIERPAWSPVRRKRLLILGPAFLVLVVALGVAVVARPWDRGAPPPIIQVLPGDHEGAVAYLNELAASAGTATGSDDGGSRYLYVKSRIAFVAFSGGEEGTGEPVRAVMAELHDREIWKPLFAGGQGRLTEADRPSDLGPVPMDPDLPEDPDVLLRQIYAGVQPGQGNSRDGQAFTVVGDLLRESMPAPAEAAALYRAAARIPGVELVRDAVDAVGRSGVAVARTEDARRREWIFDRATGDYLGERSYLVKDTDYGNAGMLLGTAAEIDHAVVGKLGERP
ncbi:CU044_5270 family protein [Actinoplanes derwentensis]|uniref:CU044_5270 family protein n=1 Tax=Actinoplanes derwentensis TaxID=113562 RepID=A0A1H1QWI6_9ACTN|nr:CU044_5270 family protein [Actinoplanes derwentensis]GID87067.1 hypothetical protein Ade03nite_59910 [Actinoplanes derwentensis]SDS27229.1 hypothetical protein SAMN04489716_0407 [Actinoplanes derwentensis]